MGIGDERDLGGEDDERFGMSARIAWGGKPVYGVRLGILLLEARFPRIPGDMLRGCCRRASGPAS
ncbi:MAG TPA: hypothetical protein VGF34_12330 [Stellaceae bacterium]|jgi:hypothetical protein